MLTVSGIPLLFPFFPNPCVIPGNPAFQFKSGDYRAEIVVCGLCGILCFTMQSLFANGFRTSYNLLFCNCKTRQSRKSKHRILCYLPIFIHSQHANLHWRSLGNRIKRQRFNFIQPQTNFYHFIKDKII